MKLVLFLVVLVWGVSGGCKDENRPPASSASTLRVNGSTTVNLPVAEAAEILRVEEKMVIQIDTQGGSSGGISMLADGLADIGMISKPVSDDDRRKYPHVAFHAVKIGEDAVALVVSKDVWDGGVHTVSRQQIKDIYEGRVVNWSQLGGPDRRIAFFNKEPGRGTWEVFATWAYGNPGQAPAANFPEVGGNDEARNKVASTSGALSQLSSSWVDGRTIFPLAVKDEDGTDRLPTLQEVAAGNYPMSRPLYLITNGPPTGNAKRLVDFMLGPRGQELVRKHGYLSLSQLKAQ